MEPKKEVDWLFLSNEDAEKIHIMFSDVILKVSEKYNVDTFKAARLILMSIGMCLGYHNYPQSDIDTLKAAIQMPYNDIIKRFGNDDK